MRILVYGAGVIGSIYGARLRQAGHEVVVLARAARVEQLRLHGLQVQEVQADAQATIRVEAVPSLAPDDPFDLVIVPVRRDQLEGVLPDLAASRATPSVLFLGNHAGGADRLAGAIGRERVLLGFPGVAGERDGDVVRYMLVRQQPTMLGELEGRRTERLQRIKHVLEAAGFPVAVNARMQLWLVSNAVFIVPLQAALAIHQGDARGLARDRRLLRLAIRATRQGFRSLASLGRLEAPVNLRLLYLWMPTWLAAAIWRREVTRLLGLAAPREEIVVLAQDLRTALAAAPRPAPALEQILREAAV